MIAMKLKTFLRLSRISMTAMMDIPKKQSKSMFSDLGTNFRILKL
jgi:hypothetical protein